MERLEYKAELEWDGNVGSTAKVREFTFKIDTNTDGRNSGPNPTEYLLSAIGGCLTVNWGRLIKKMRLDVGGFKVEVRGWRNLEEPRLGEITYKITVITREPEEKNGTVFNTVGAEKIKGEVEILRP
ncbi:OsmC family protein [Thermococcus zilligii]|uniref:OsmC family protein n=1 Tax=Thermococcus zilligii TaxID=54076 RepID=UPI00029AE68E|nr:OsmC family protein [Thermococcus zilligii]